MKKVLTLTLFFAAMFIAGSVSAQERVSKNEVTADTAKVNAQQDTVKSKKDKKKPESKTAVKKEEKEEMKGGSNETDRMAIDELGMPVDKKDKKKKATNKSNNSSGTKKD